MKQKIVISKHLSSELAIAISECNHDKIFVLVDTTTYEKCWQVINGFLTLRNAILIIIDATDAHKDIENISKVWQMLSDNKATRQSLLINLGGGMVTDLGGFAAATFKRGIDFINIPTTLLAMVDASVGGKTGINFNGLKNEIGVFCDAKCVILSTMFLSTLDDKNIRSGYAEMLKHGLISDRQTWADLINFNLAEPDLQMLQQMVAQSVKVKENIVEEDPREKDIRKALNLGHTIGHAIESLALSKGSPILHGYAVAYGIVAELYLSSIKCGFPTEVLRQTVAFIKEYYGIAPIICDDYDILINYMRHDKKNSSDKINFTLLSDIGNIHINQFATTDEIKEALDFLRDGM